MHAYICFNQGKSRVEWAVLSRQYVVEHVPSPDCKLIPVRTVNRDSSQGCISEAQQGTSKTYSP